MGTVAGKIALVTGAGGGIGQGIALELARQGAHVALHYANQATGAHETMQECQRMGLENKVLMVQGDLSQVSECRRVVDTVTQAWDGIGILVNNAGVTSARDFLTVDEETYNQVFHLNMRDYFFCAQQAIRSMLKRGGGSIVNISSAHSFGGFPRHTAYAATKGAINAFTRQLAIDMAPHHIRVNAVAPGIIESPDISPLTVTLLPSAIPLCHGDASVIQRMSRLLLPSWLHQRPILLPARFSVWMEERQHAWLSGGIRVSSHNKSRSVLILILSGTHVLAN